MGEIGSGGGSGYPAALDTNSSLEVDSPAAGKTKARADVPNDLAAACVAIETELGTDPAGSLADVKTRLAVSINDDGTIKSTAVSVGAGGFQKLIISRPTAATVDIDADHVELVTAAGATFTATAVNLTADITASGANGLDTGAEANSTWYAVWVIYNGTTTASLLSVSTTIGAITFPSGYTYGKLVGFARNDGSGDLIDFSQWGDTAWWKARQSIASGLNQTSYTTQDISGEVPSASGLVREVLFSGIDSAAAEILSLSDDGVNAKAIFGVQNTGATVGGINEIQDTNSGGAATFVPINGDNIYFKTASAASVELFARAFKLNI